MKNLLPFAVAAAGAAVFLAGCGAQPAAPSAQPAATASGANPATSGASSTPEAPAASGTATAAADACPVTAGTLYTALRSGKNGIYERAAKPAGLETPTCYQNFAVAQRKPDGVHENAMIVFGYQAATREWVPLNLGTADYCDGHVPPAIAAKLGNC